MLLLLHDLEFSSLVVEHFVGQLSWHFTIVMLLYLVFTSVPIPIALFYLGIKFDAINHLHAFQYPDQ